MPATDPADVGRADAPSAAMRRLLVAAVGHAETAQEAWSAWLRDVDIEHLERGATTLLSLVSRNVADLGDDPSVVGRVRGVHRQTWARNQVLWAAGSPLIDRLSALAVGPILLPPTALVDLYDDDWGARPLERIEMALAPDAVEQARTALADTGWAVDHITPRLRSRTRVGLVERWQSQDESDNWVTIRWHVLHQISSGVADEQLRGAAGQSSVGSSSVHLLHPADALLERLWASSRQRTPAWIADVVVLARRLERDEGALGSERFAERAQRFAVQPVVADRLALVAATVPDPAVSAALDAVRTKGPTAASALRSLPSPARHLGQAWAGHAAGQGVVRGARSLVRAQWSAGRFGSFGSSQRR